MRLIEIKSTPNGAHNNQTTDYEMEIPEGYAVIPDEIETPNFPFGDIVVENNVVTSWKPLPIPEHKPEPIPPTKPTQMDILSSQMTYTAMKTGTLLPEPKKVTMTRSVPKNTMYDSIKQWYEWGLWTAEMVQEAVPTLLTQEQVNEILAK